MTGTDREAMSPHQAIADGLFQTAHSDYRMTRTAYERRATAVLDALAAAGYQVVPDNLVQAGGLVVDHASVIEQGTGREYIDRLAAALAQHRGADPLEVFTKDGA